MGELLLAWMKREMWNLPKFLWNLFFTHPIIPCASNIHFCIYTAYYLQYQKYKKMTTLTVWALKKASLCFPLLWGKEEMLSENMNESFTLSLNIWDCKKSKSKPETFKNQLGSRHCAVRNDANLWKAAKDQISCLQCQLPCSWCLLKF